MESDAGNTNVTPGTEGTKRAQANSAMTLEAAVYEFPAMTLVWRRPLVIFGNFIVNSTACAGAAPIVGRMRPRRSLVVPRDATPTPRNSQQPARGPTQRKPRSKKNGVSRIGNVLDKVIKPAIGSSS